MEPTVGAEIDDLDLLAEEVLARLPKLGEVVDRVAKAHAASRLRRLADEALALLS